MTSLSVGTQSYGIQGIYILAHLIQMSNDTNSY